MKDILNDIIADKRIEVATAKAQCNADTLRHEAEGCQRQKLSMRQALEGSLSGIISEFKRRSPSKGWIFETARVEEVIPHYAAAGASAISILTDTPYFGGTLADLEAARRFTSTTPLLRKDFVIDPYQLYQARLSGADAVLLIAAALSTEQCRELAEEAHALNLEVLLEVHTELELNHYNPFVDMLGVNNRNLGTFHTSLENSFSLADKITTLDAVAVSESGISSPETVRELRTKGFKGFLIGENFMKGGTPGETLEKFIRDVEN